MTKIQFFHHIHRFHSTFILWAVGLGGLTLGTTGCEKPKTFSEIPYLEYRSSALSSSVSSSGEEVPLLDLTFYFQDGDGDIGNLNQQAVLFFALQKKIQDTLYEQVYAVNDTGGRFAIEYAYYLQPIPPVNSTNAIYGTMTWRMEEFADLMREYANQTVRFAIWLFDEKQHKSNVIYSEDFHLR